MHRAPVLLAVALVANAASATTVRLRLPPTAAKASAACEAHVALLDGGAERVGKCDTAIDVPPGAAVGWIEQSSQISRWTIDVSHGGVFQSPQLGRAAAVIVVSARPLREGEHALLIGLTPPAGASLFARPVGADSIAISHNVPEGSVLGLIVDRKGEVVAVAKPADVAAPTVTRIELAVNPGAPDVVSFLDRPSAEPFDPLTVLLVSADGRRGPDAFVDSGETAVAVWFAQKPGSARLTLDSRSLRLTREGVEIARAGVTTVRRRLERLPTLSVSIGPLPASVNRDALPPLMLSVLNAAGDSPVRPRSSAAPDTTYDFKNVPAAPVLVMLEIGAFKTGSRADLTAGRDVRVDIPLEPVPVSGTVFFGDTAAKAEIRFRQKGEPVKAVTDDQGRYAVTLWEERRYFIDLQLLDHPSVPPFQDVFQVTADETLDFHVPGIRFAARIHDSDSGKPVPNATVVVRNVWSGENGAQSSVRSFPSDADPITELPPQHPGTSELRVSAPGYLDGGPLVSQIDPAVHDRVVDVPMHRAAETVRIDIRLPDATQAAGAEVAVSPNGSDVAWRGSVGVDGHADVPKAFSGMLLLVRHRDAASASSRLPTGDDPVSLQLSRAAPPVTVVVTTTDDSPVANAIYAWIGGARLSAAALSFMSWSNALTDRDRHWTARNLPPESLTVLAVRGPHLQQAAAGLFDAIAQTVPYPWPPTVSIRAIE